MLHTELRKSHLTLNVDHTAASVKRLRPILCVCVCVYIYICIYIRIYIRGPGSSVSIVTDYRLDGPRSNPGGDEIFRSSRPVLGPTQPPVQWVPGLSRG